MYKKYASDRDFSQGLNAAIQRIIEHALKSGQPLGADADQ